MTKAVTIVAIGLLCAIAIVGIGAVVSSEEASTAIGRVIFAAAILTVFSLVAMAGVALVVRRPALNWFGYSTVLVALAAFALATWKLWDAGFLFGEGWELPVAAIAVALACGQLSLLLAWVPENGPVALVAVGAAVMVIAMAALAVFSIVFDNFRVDVRVYAVLAILYLLGIALLPLLTLSGSTTGAARRN